MAWWGTQRRQDDVVHVLTGDERSSLTLFVNLIRCAPQRLPDARHI